MKNIVKLTPLILIIFIQSVITAQNTYIAKDSAYSYGITIIEGTDFSNSLICKVKKGKNEIEYTPDELTEYGTKNGRVYFSKELNIHGFSKKYFIERLVKGDINLYYLKLKKEKLFFIEKDSTVFIKLPKNDINSGNIIYKDILKEYCNDSNAVKFVKYNKKALPILIERHNFGITKPFPFIKYGIIIGFSGTQINSPVNTTLNHIQNLKSKFDKNITAGAFLNIPISLSYFSFHPEIYFTQNAFSETVINNNTETDILIKFSSINVPFLFRYTYPSNKIRPFVNLGALYSYHFNYEQETRQATFDDNIITLTGDVKLENALSQQQLGYSGGIGLQYSLDYRKSVFFELRYSKQFGLPDFTTLQKTEFHLITGINF